MAEPTAPVSSSGLLFEGAEADPKAPKKRTTSAAKAAALAEHLPPNLGKPLKVKVPDFSNPNRSKTCLEVDFPLVPINALSALEGNAGKPIYQMSKWWARRRSCVFRALLLAAAMEAPTRKHPDGQPMLGPDGKPIVDEDAAAQLVWDAYYANHQLAGNFKNLKVLDPFMGGGTTLVEGSRLGFQVAGVDLNPVAWFIVKNELACTDPAEVKAFFEKIEAEVKPQIQPFYVTDCVGGRKSTWFKPGSDGSKEKMPPGFDPISLPPDQRKPYQYDGPEVIYTFWAKHGPCSKPGCNHRTPIFRSPIVATKKLGVKYLECTCKQCKTAFHAELGDARIAPDAENVVLPNEHRYTVVSPGFTKRMLEYSEGTKADKNRRIGELSELVETEAGFNCPRCGSWSGQTVRDVLAMHVRATRMSEIDKKHLGILPKAHSKKPVYCTLLIDPDWLKGSPGDCSDGSELGGYIDAPIDATDKWYRERLNNLRLIEVRGTATEQAKPEGESNDGDTAEEQSLPQTINLRDGRQINTRAETIARKANGKEWDSHFVCAACGTPQDLRLSMQQTRRTAPVAPYAIQAYDVQRQAGDHPYGGRYFMAPSKADMQRLVAAEREWASRKDADLDGYWPREELPFAYMTHQANFALPEQGYTHWYKMFNPRQLVTHAIIMSRIAEDAAPVAVKHQVLGAVQQYLRMQNMFVFWHITYDKIAPALSNPNYHPKNNIVENNVFGAMGYGTWLSCASTVVEALEWCREPKELAVAPAEKSAKTIKVEVGDAVLPGANIHCGSSSEMVFKKPFDLVITDPPFGDNIFYSDLANFFYAWIRLPLRDPFPDLFGSTKTPNAQEALKPRVLPEAEGNQHYYDRLTPCWAESCRVMKDGGIMAFTFHHSEDAQWEIVLRSLFESGFVLEAVYPIASDEMKGVGGQFGAKGTEYDMIHVCRKRLEEPRPVSWPKMRQWVKGELSRLRPLLESFKNRGLSDADVRVILRGKALEFFSRHYGKVMVNVPGGEEAVLSIRDALLGINQLLDESSGAPGERPPSIVQPVVYQYLRLFGVKATYSRDEVSKLLRGTTIQQNAFEKAGSTPWIAEEDKVVTRVPIYDRFQKMVKRSRRELKTELDQSHFLIGAAMPAQDGDTSVNIEKELERETFLIRPGVEALLDWYSKTPAGPDEPGIPKAASTALQLLRAAFEAKRARMQQEDPTLFDEWAASMATVA
jgi:putative DNA methylase